jgi:hypothetical protein
VSVVALAWFLGPALVLALEAQSDALPGGEGIASVDGPERQRLIEARIAELEVTEEQLLERLAVVLGEAQRRTA